MASWRWFMYVPRFFSHSSETRAAALIHQLVPRFTGQCALLLLFISETLIRLDHPNLKPNFLTLYDSILESPCSFFIVAVIDSCHGQLLFALLISICVFFVDWHFVYFPLSSWGIPSVRPLYWLNSTTYSNVLCRMWHSLWAFVYLSALCGTWF